MRTDLRRVPLAILLAIAMATSAAAAPARAPSARRALLISVDGLRPDLMLRANTPTLHDLMRQGSFSMWARTTAVSITLPSHTSMLTGVPPARHGIDWNRDLPFSEIVYPRVPTLFELAKKAGRTTAMVAGKKKFEALAKPGTLDWCFVPSVTVVSDEQVADSAVAMIARHHPEVMFVHLPAVDTAGHEHGWGSDAQLDAIETADRCISAILGELRRQELLQATVVIVSSDHGGAGTEHGPDDPRSRTIPWLISGPGVRQGLDLTLDRDLVINTEDTFATICYLTRIPLPEHIDGRPVLAAMDSSLADSPAGSPASATSH
ncbi:MAG TPA: ectonucleotide pyrophosphatase/phosphodiesterase [Candidatus Sulfotelmatobacter sp.]|nr:ectonucleotide pyrophosphatase/phosphodiesterase [Candidatus Sulfotelmatobacter sp.]